MYQKIVDASFGLTLQASRFSREGQPKQVLQEQPSLPQDPAQVKMSRLQQMLCALVMDMNPADHLCTKLTHWHMHAKFSFSMLRVIAICNNYNTI